MTTSWCGEQEACLQTGSLTKRLLSGSIRCTMISRRMCGRPGASPTAPAAHPTGDPAPEAQAVPTPNPRATRRGSPRRILAAVRPRVTCRVAPADARRSPYIPSRQPPRQARGRLRGYIRNSGGIAMALQERTEGRYVDAADGPMLPTIGPVLRMCAETTSGFISPWYQSPLYPPFRTAKGGRAQRGNGGCLAQDIGHLECSPQ